MPLFHLYDKSDKYLGFCELSAEQKNVLTRTGKLLLRGYDTRDLFRAGLSPVYFGSFSDTSVTIAQVCLLQHRDKWPFAVTLFGEVGDLEKSCWVQQEDKT